MERPRPRRQQQPRGQGLCHAIKVMACGGMIGTALLFPLASDVGLWLRAVTLSIFILAALGFHALNLEPFLSRLGRCIAAAALVVLLVAVLAAGDSKTDLIPWLPFFMATSSLGTVVVHEISQQMGSPRLSAATDEQSSRDSVDAQSNGSRRTDSTRQGPPFALESTRHDPLYFARHGPSSRTSHWVSHRTGTDATDNSVSLSSIAGQTRPQWDPRTLSHFAEAPPPGQDHPGQPYGRNSSPGGESTRAPDSDLDSNLDSEDDTVEPSRPLLESRRESL